RRRRQHSDRQHLHRSGAKTGQFLHPRRRGRSSHRRSAVGEQRVPRWQHESARSERCREDGRRRVRLVPGHREIPRGVLEIDSPGGKTMKKLWGLFLLALLASGCATTGDVTAFKDADDTSKIQESEGRLWHEARSYDTTIE